MRTRLESLEARRREILDHLVIITDLEKKGSDMKRKRIIYASKLRHVEASILKLKQGRLFT